MRYLALSEVVELHRRLLEQAGGPAGIRDLGALESALAQPRMTLAGDELYPTLVETSASATRPWRRSSC
jgi:death-on-curing protein